MHSRRRLLHGGALAVAGALGGCLGSAGGPGGSGGSDGESGGESRLSLPALEVAGSPGGRVVVKPPGTVTLLDFFATWCAPCKPQMEELRTVHDRFPDVHMLSITQENDESAIRSFWREYEGTWPVARDPNLRASTRYRPGRVPTMIVLDADGDETWRHSGLAAAADIGEELTAAGATPA